MSLAWTDLAAAFALYLVLEGIMPFLNPAAMRRALSRFLMLPDSQLRLAGLASMAAGAAMLWLVRG
jgi:uncharacterized protein YjeT (DUF2065 family)